MCMRGMGAGEDVRADVIGIGGARCTLGTARAVFANPGWSSNGSGPAVNLPLTVGCVLH